MSGKRHLLQVAGDLKHELDALMRLIDESQACRDEFQARTPSPLEVRGVGDVVHDFYNAVERYLERVAVELNGGLPAGADWYARLLERMSRSLEGVRPAVLRVEVRSKLHEFMRFRHLFRHRYGFELEWERIEPLLQGVGRLAPELLSDLRGFIDSVRDLAQRIE